MELTKQQQKEVADSIATENPEILLQALRNNGFWMYAVSKNDVEQYIEDGEYVQDLSVKPPSLPITDEDMKHVNYFDDFSKVIDYHEVMTTILNFINDKRYNEIYENGETK